MDKKTVAKVYIHRHQEKIEQEFTELFQDDLKDWLLEEIRLNKRHPISDTQMQFWKAQDPGSGVHDPRGCPSYVKECIENFPINDHNDKKPNVYIPHPNLLQEIVAKTCQ